MTFQPAASDCSASLAASLLSLTARSVQPPRGQSCAGVVAPGCQFGLLSLAADKVHHPVPGIEHPARLSDEPGIVNIDWPGVLAQCERRSAAQLRAPRFVPEPVRLGRGAGLRLAVECLLNGLD